MREAARSVLHAIGPLHRALSRWRGTLIHWPDYRRADALRLGSSYGGWTVIPELIDRNSVVYSVGVGSDITFDLALIARFGCAVHAFDPTPMARDWIARQSTPPEFHFHPLGLANEDETVGFVAPRREGWDSFSLPAAGSDAPLTLCPVRRLETLVADLGHQQIDVLKMDIEGFEFGVIDDVLAGPIRPGQWLIEFHHTMMHFLPDQTRRAVGQLIAAGYRLFSVSNVGHEYSFVHKSALDLRDPAYSSAPISTT
jgi:FkbM family methyltransferase